MTQPTACARCGDFVDQRAAYSDDGEFVCSRCEALGDLSAGAERAASGLMSMAFGALALAALSMFFNPFFLASIGTFASTYTWQTTVRRNPEYAVRLRRRKYVCWAVLLTACVVASFDFLRLFVAMLIVAFAR